MKIRSSSRETSFLAFSAQLKEEIRVTRQTTVEFEISAKIQQKFSEKEKIFDFGIKKNKRRNSKIFWF